MDKKFIKDNPVFFSRLGFAYDPPIKGEDGKPVVFSKNFEREAAYNKRFSDAGIKLHTSILHAGWVGVDEYDYSVTDKTLKTFFEKNPDCLYIPRVKLNVPVDWCRENPDEVFVYHNGPRKREEIRNLCGTLRQDYLGYDDENGYYQSDGDFKDVRPNLNSLISLQSFSSEKWKEDAGEALRRLIRHIANSPYADRVIGYHIAYGACGESMMWGRASFNYGDYGISNLRNFYNFGLNKYGSEKILAEKWNQKNISIDNVELPMPCDRYDGKELYSFFRADSIGTISADYDEFLSKANADAIDYFSKIIKTENPEKLVGVFYGYFEYMSNSAYAGHLNINQVLESPYVDYIAAPKSYHRCGPGEPGGEMCPAQSINMKKVYLDEMDNRTFLYRKKGEESSSDDLKKTVAVLWREMIKNISHDSGFWWMDLGGGWYESDELMREVSFMHQNAVRYRKQEHKSVADILILVDEECIFKMGVSNDATFGFMQDFITEMHLTGAICDIYRLSDLPELNTSQYKMAALAYTFRIDGNMQSIIDEKLSGCNIIMYNYAAGIWSDEVCSVDNVEKLTGMKVEAADEGKYDFPKIRICNPEFVLLKSEEDECMTGKRKYKGIDRVLNVQPYISKDVLIDIVKSAGCHRYCDNAVIYGDNRVIGIFSPDCKIDTILNMREDGKYREIISGNIYDSGDIDLHMDAWDYKIFEKIE